MKDQAAMLAAIRNAIVDELFRPSPWESTFLESVGELVDFELALSEEQDRKLEEIWERATR